MGCCWGLAAHTGGTSPSGSAPQPPHEWKGCGEASWERGPRCAAEEAPVHPQPPPLPALLPPGTAEVSADAARRPRSPTGPPSPTATLPSPHPAAPAAGMPRDAQTPGQSPGPRGGSTAVALLTNLPACASPHGPTWLSSTGDGSRPLTAGGAGARPQPGATCVLRRVYPAAPPVQTQHATPVATLHTCLPASPPPCRISTLPAPRSPPQAGASPTPYAAGSEVPGGCGHSLALKGAAEHSPPETHTAQKVTASLVPSRCS